MEYLKHYQYTTFLEKRGKLFLGLTAILIILSVIGITLVEIETDFSVFMPKDSGQMIRMEEMNDHFGDSDQILVLVQMDGSVNSL